MHAVLIAMICRMIQSYLVALVLEENMKWLHVVAFTLTIVGALNWGLVGLFNYNLVAMLFGGMPGIEKLVYIAVGVSAVILLVTHKDDCKACMSMMKMKK